MAFDFPPPVERHERARPSHARSVSTVNKELHTPHPAAKMRIGCCSAALLLGCAHLRCQHPLLGIDGPSTPDFLPQGAVDRVENAEMERARTLSERLSDLQAADERERRLMAMDEAKFPVVCFDAMLPGQVMELETTDPGFSTLLCSLCLGGLFVMVSLNGRQRRVRRHGVLVRVALVDAMRSREHLPTSVRARLIARERVVLCGPDRQRVARWRRQYDPDGEVPAMGWGDEPICATFGYCAARRRRLTYRTATTARWRACRRCSTAATRWRSPARACAP